MKVLSIGTDRQLFTPGSQVGKRAVAYGRHFEQYQQIVFALKKYQLEPVKLNDKVWAYPTNSLSHFFYLLDAIKIGNRLLKQNSGNWVISAQDPFETGLAACWLAWWHQLPFQLQIHTDFLSQSFANQSLLNRLRVLMARLILPQASGIRVVSERIRQSIAKANIKIKVEPAVLPIVVNQSVGQIGGENLRTKYPQFTKLVLAVSRLEPEKNVALAIRTFTVVAKNQPQTGLIIVGSGSEENELKILVNQLNLDDKVIFAGQQNNLAAYYQSADILLNTSNYEGYGLVLAEARLADLPVVSTDVGIARELVGAESVCPIGDEKCLAKKVELVLLGQVKQPPVSADLVETDFDRYVEKYVNLLKQCQNR